MGGRSASSSGGGGASRGGAAGSFGGATEATQGQHKAQLKALKSPSYEDGTYEIGSLTPVDYDSGFQVTFSQKWDRYSNEEYAQKVNEFLAVSSDGKVLAGKFENHPEVSFHVNSKATAKKLAQKYNQISIWDWKNGCEIKTGGTGSRRKR